MLLLRCLDSKRVADFLKRTLRAWSATQILSFDLGQMELRHTSLRLLTTPPHLISYLGQMDRDYLLHFSISPKARCRALRSHLGHLTLGNRTHKSILPVYRPIPFTGDTL